METQTDVTRNGAPKDVHVTEPPARPSAPRQRKRPIFAIGGAIVVLLALIIGTPWLRYAASHETTDDAYVDADIVAVTSKIQEKIDHLLVTTNQPVHKGQVLVVLDDKNESAELRQAQANYDLALANQRTTTVQQQGSVTEAVGTVSTQASQVPIAQAGVDQAQAQLEITIADIPAAQEAYAKARADYDRTVSLVGTGDIPRSDLDAARANIAQAAATLRSSQDQVLAARANVTAAVAKVSAQEADVEAAQGGLTTAQGRLQQAADPSQVEVAKAQLEQAKLNLGFTRITSPIDGTVGQKSAEVGQTVSPGTTIMTLVPQSVYITASFKETQTGSMRVGQPVDIHVDAYKNVTFHGHVTSINPASQNTYALVPPQNATGNFVKVTQRIPVRISIDDMRADMPLRPGMSVETSVLVK